MKWSRVDTALTIAALALSVWTIWYVMREFDDSNPAATRWYRLMRMCQSSAEHIGRLGIYAEGKYHAILDTERMI